MFPSITYFLLSLISQKRNPPHNFETLVQRALGILMIAVLAGIFFKEEEDTNMMV
jgi:hypothetical protein